MKKPKRIMKKPKCKGAKLILLDENLKFYQL